MAEQLGNEYSIIVTAENAAVRLDQFLANHNTAHTRSFFRNLINTHCVTVNDKPCIKAGYAIKSGDKISVKIPLPVQEKAREGASDLPVELVYEHPDFLIINKPAGLVVHAPDHGSTDLTLVDWLTAKFQEIADVGSSERAGIVHRLDMNTSGLMVIPRTNQALAMFGDLFKDRLIKKTYYALVQGHPPKEGVINVAIVRHPVHRNKMTHVPPADAQQQKYARSRTATTHYKVLEYFEDAALVEAKPLTGRTHQIRVHFASIGCPLLADEVYGKKSSLMQRHALHAYGLAFDYQGNHYSFMQEPPQDFLQAEQALRAAKTF